MLKQKFEENYENSLPKPCPERSRRVYIRTFGCQMNDADSEIISSIFSEYGVFPTYNLFEASFIYINTCCVREKAENKFASFLGEIRQLKNKNSDLVVGVGGCIAESKNLSSQYPFLDFVIGAKDPQEYRAKIQDIIVKKNPELRTQNPELRTQNTEPVGSEQLVVGKPRATSHDSITELLNHHQLSTSQVKTCYSIEPATSNQQPATSPSSHQSFSHTKYYTVVRGCSNFCTYCVVPYTRGPEISKLVKTIYKDVFNLVKNGAREITLLGQNILSYGRDISTEYCNINLLNVIEEIHNIFDLKRIRFITFHPKFIDENFLENLVVFPKVCEHFHMPCQSGDDTILARMQRGYTAFEYKEKVEMIRHYFPDASITADIIVGFPGETSKQFENTLKLLDEVKIDSAFTFKYSPRPKTQADEYTDDVSAEEKAERLALLNNLQNQISLNINRTLINSTQEVMIDEISTKTNLKKVEQASCLLNKIHKTDACAVGKGRTRTNKVVQLLVHPVSAQSVLGNLTMARIESATPHGLKGLKVNDVVD